ncbi:sensor histidine kinase [Vallitalea okinawensis]|uniref:sensor histidine kinase n=1 Tax=Vallitalea okinawensis TaxID=2078660 RepID=UPI000CFC8A70|nr:HAMP domain-containing sensor histidine kinase [Vallitalea okinawensis]
MIKSLKAKLLLIYSGIMLLILFSAWFTITYFSQTYYEYRKEELMKEYGATIENIIANSNNARNDMDEALFADLSLSFEGEIIILDSTYALIYTDSFGFMRRIGNTPFDFDNVNEGVTRYSRSEFINLLNPDIKIKGVPPNAKNDNDLLLYNKIDSYGNLIIIYMPIKSIQDSVNIIQQLLYMITIIALLLISILTFIISRNIINPVIEVKNIAIKMSSLDFSQRCNQQRNDEIGELSSSINVLSDKLEVTINQLKTELKKEKSTDQLRKQFIGQVSHELQTPLSIINSYIEALMDGVITSNDEVDSSYQIIQEESEKISKIVRDLLDLSQLESGVFKVEFNDFNIGLLLDQLYYKYHELVKAKQFTFNVSGVESGYIIKGDSIRIEQAISNLIQNAIKYTNPGGQITLSMRPQNNYIQILVENTGHKIAEKDIDLIWESFYKNKNSKKEGIGLGLAIAKQIVTLHGGDYFVRNTDEGVVFGINLVR